MTEFHLITVGKLKDHSLKKIEDDYLKRLHSFSFHIHELKALQENKEKEADSVLSKVSQIEVKKAFCILLAENGESYTSTGFSQKLSNWNESYSQVVFIIGGASGHGEKVLERADKKLSLSKMTMPHQLARVVFVEQLYRAQTINEGHPYHK